MSESHKLDGTKREIYNMLLQQYLECLGATGNAEARLGEFIRMAVPGEGKWTFNRETAEYTKEVIEEPAHEPEAIAEPV